MCYNIDNKFKNSLGGNFMLQTDKNDDIIINNLDETLVLPLKEETVRKVKPRAAEAITEYKHIAQIIKYFLQKEQYRNLMLFVTGISTGLRISDLVNLLLHDIFEDDGVTFKRSIDKKTIKTGAPTVNSEDEVLITESVQIVVMLYLSNLKSKPSLDDYLFLSPRAREGSKDENANTDRKKMKRNSLKGQHVLSETSAHAILKKVQRELQLPYNLGSHSLRKTFAVAFDYIASCALSECQNPNHLFLTQKALSHKSQATTMRYLGTTKRTNEMIRRKVSDFILGKTEFKSTVAEIILP